MSKQALLSRVCSEVFCSRLRYLGLRGPPTLWIKASVHHSPIQMLRQSRRSPQVSSSLARSALRAKSPGYVPPLQTASPVLSARSPPALPEPLSVTLLAVCTVPRRFHYWIVMLAVITLRSPSFAVFDAARRSFPAACIFGPLLARFCCHFRRRLYC
jgi:hypothetical protein